MTKLFGPFQVLDNSTQVTERNYDCDNYSKCLNLTAALNWEGFTCENCCGDLNQALNWRALHAQKNDPLAQKICRIEDPTIEKKKSEVA